MENKGYIYILTNPSFKEYVKIGYADNVENRLRQLNNSECTPFAFRVYATYEVFLLKGGNKIYPIEVKSSGYTSHTSIDEFCSRYRQYMNGGIIIYSKNLKFDGKYTYLPVYMTMCL